jgi:hypothetical protein
MANITPFEFHDLVVRFFEPLARDANVSLIRLRDDIYEFGNEQFVIRIRRGIYRDRNRVFFVTLSRRKPDPEDLENPRNEIGLGNFAEYNNYPFTSRDLRSSEDWKEAFEEAAVATRKLCIPYLTGERKDFEDIVSFVERKIEATGIRTKKWNLPPNVIKKW